MAPATTSRAWTPRSRQTGRSVVQGSDTLPVAAPTAGRRRRRRSDVGGSQASAIARAGAYTPHLYGTLNAPGAGGRAAPRRSATPAARVDGAAYPSRMDNAAVRPGRPVRDPRPARTLRRQDVLTLGALMTAGAQSRRDGRLRSRLARRPRGARRVLRPTRRRRWPGRLRAPGGGDLRRRVPPLRPGDRRLDAREPALRRAPDAAAGTGWWVLPPSQPPAIDRREHPCRGRRGPGCPGRGGPAGRAGHRRRGRSSGAGARRAAPGAPGRRDAPTAPSASATARRAPP